jgi:ribosomal protein S18 acetylase RimI-like enzyme
MLDVRFEQLQEHDLREAYDLCTRCVGCFTTFEDVCETYQRCKDDKNYHFITGKYNGRIIAYATMAIVYNLFDGTFPMAYLWYVCVHEDFRRQGVASALFREIDRIADENKVEIISLSCLSDNTDALKFYRAIGYTEDKDVNFVKNIYEMWD